MGRQRVIVKASAQRLDARLLQQDRTRLVQIPALEVRPEDDFQIHRNGRYRYYWSRPSLTPDGKALFYVVPFQRGADANQEFRFFVARHRVIDGKGIYWRVPELERAGFLESRVFTHVTALDHDRLSLLVHLDGGISHFMVRCEPGQSSATVLKRHVYRPASYQDYHYPSDQVTGHALLESYDASTADSLDPLLIPSDIQGVEQPHYCCLYGVRSRLNREVNATLPGFDALDISLGRRGIYAVIGRRSANSRSSWAMDPIRIVGLEWSSAIEGTAGCWCARRAEDARFVQHHVAPEHHNIPDHLSVPLSYRFLNSSSRGFVTLLAYQRDGDTRSQVSTVETMRVFVLDLHDPLLSGSSGRTALRCSYASYQYPGNFVASSPGDVIRGAAIQLFTGHPSGTLFMAHTRSAFPRVIPSLFDLVLEVVYANLTDEMRGDPDWLYKITRGVLK